MNERIMKEKNREDYLDFDILSTNKVSDPLMRQAIASLKSQGEHGEVSMGVVLDMMEFLTVKKEDVEDDRFRFLKSLEEVEAYKKMVASGFISEEDYAEARKDASKSEQETQVREDFLPLDEEAALARERIMMGVTVDNSFHYEDYDEEELEEMLVHGYISEEEYAEAMGSKEESNLEPDDEVLEGSSMEMDIGCREEKRRLYEERIENLDIPEHRKEMLEQMVPYFIHRK